MKLAYSWLSDFVKLDDISRHDFVEGMTMSGSKVEGVDCAADEIENIVVGKVLKIDRHPDADKLVVCLVDVGNADKKITIVTGATNLSEGDIVPVALDGSSLPGGKKINAGKLRGIVSEGMLCSLPELGLSENDFPNCGGEDGIMILPTEYADKIGQNVVPLLGLDDMTVEFEITPNRPDCLSVRSLAREAAVTFDKPFNDLVVPNYPTDGAVKDRLKVDIDTKNCSRYTAAIVKNVKIEPSPAWMRQRLRMCGMRPINNIVDITNYICLLFGHPMHAFDFRYVNDAHITVRQAVSGEEIVTLDGATHKLTPDNTVIADTKGPIAVAGVMGGEFSGIYPDTVDVVFESACFDGPSVRTTAKQLLLRTESSARFEKGLSPENTMPALFYALSLVEKLGCGEVESGIIDVYTQKPQPRNVPYSPDEINALLGTDISKDEMDDILTRLGFTLEGDNVSVPYFRYDVKLSCDLAEEIARIYGYNKLVSEPIKASGSARSSRRQRFDEEMRDKLIGYGLYENMSFSFYSRRHFDLLKLSSEDSLRDAIEIMNPLGEDTSIMRTTAIPSMLTVLATNYNARAPHCAMFEFATEYIKSEDNDPFTLPKEPKKVIIGMYGPEVDFFTVKGIAEGLFAAASTEPAEGYAVTDIPYLHSGRAAVLKIGDRAVATIGEVHPDVALGYGIKTRCYIADISLDDIYEVSGGTSVYKALSKYPALTRDLCVVADKSIPHREIASTISKAAGDLLVDLKLFDVFESLRLGEDRRSLAYSLKLQSYNSTLTDTEADGVTSAVLDKLKEMGVVLREE